MSENHEFPNRWAKAELGLVSIIVRGITFPSNAKRLEPQDGDIACLRTANVQREVDWEDLWFVNSEFVRRQEQFLQTDDILISTANSYELVGKVSLVRYVPQVASLGAFISLIRSDEHVAPKFIYHQLESLTVVNQLREMASTTTNISNISSGKLQHLLLRIAPLNEQRRIVAKIEELFSDLDAGVAALKRAKANLKRYRASVLKAAVEGKLTEEWRAKHPAKEPASELLARILKERRQKWESDQLAKFAAAGKQPPKNWRDKYVEPSPPETDGLPELPDDWCWCTASQICEVVASGSTPSADRMQEDHGDVPFLKVYNLTFTGVLDFSKNPTFIDLETHLKQSRSIVLPGDVLINIVGPPLGKVSIVPDDFPEWNINQAIVVFRPSTPILNRYLATALMTDSVMKRVTSLAKATAGQFNIGVSMCRDLLPLPLAPLIEQQQIVSQVAERLSQIDAAELQIEHGLLRAARLRQSILKRAFEGKLVPQDPSDEPASVLLERLRAQQSIKGENQKAGTSIRTFGRGAMSKKIERRVAE